MFCFGFFFIGNGFLKKHRSCYADDGTIMIFSLQAKQGKKVMYGCSELFSAAQFLKQVLFHSTYTRSLRYIHDIVLVMNNLL